MSDAVSGIAGGRGPADSDQDKDRRRTIAGLGGAVAVHLVLLTALWLGVGRSSAPPVLPPVTIQLQDSAGTGAAPGEPGPAVSVPGPGTPAAGAPSAGAGASSGFVIPTPRSEPAGSPAASSGPSFREAGGRTGVDTGVPSTPSTQPGPAVAPVRQGTGSGSAAASGAGASSAQRSGTAVAVGGSGSPGGPLDLSGFDKALAGAGGKGAGSAGSSGTAGGSAGAGGTGGASGGSRFPVQWGSSAGEGRRLVFSVAPKLPDWVSRRGLTLAVTVRFSVLANGVVEGASIEQSSGYADVDAAVVEAIRMCLFNTVQDAPTVKGVIPYRTDWK